MSLVRLPGLIDPHVHLRDPGQIDKEDFLSGTSAALAGGFTTLIDMPNNTVPITTHERLEEKIKIAQEKIVCDIGFYFGSLGDNLDEFNTVNSKVFGLKLYLNETTGNFLIDTESTKKIFEAWPANRPILLHAEDDAVAFILALTKELRKPVHFCHISTESDLSQIIDAKNQGLPVTCGVTPHHLFLTEHDAQVLGPYGKMKPPLRSKKDVEFLWKNLSLIDVIESDHAPHTKAEKESETPPYGVPNLETTLPLLLTALSENRLTLDDVRRLCFENPSRIFRVHTDTETYVEVDTAQKYTIEGKNLFTKCKWTPYEGMTVTGVVLKTVLRGTVVYSNHTLHTKPGSGLVLSPK